MAALVEPSLSLARQRREEAREFRLLYVVCFAVFLVAAIVARILPGQRTSGQPRHRRSVIEEARAAASTSLPFAFMG